MSHEHEHGRGGGDDAERRQARALERIAQSVGIIAEHMVGGMSPEEVAAVRAQVSELRKSRIQLDAAVDAAPPTP